MKITKMLIAVSASLRCGKKSVHCAVNSKDYEALRSLVSLGVVSHVIRSKDPKNSKSNIFFTKAAINSRRTLRFSYNTAPYNRRKLMKIDFI